jgi:AraC family transcriptional regulator
LSNRGQAAAVAGGHDHGGMIAHVLTFAAHRRTLVCGALIDAGITDLGAGDPMRWVAERA